MPNKGAIADFVHSWEKMTTNVTNNAAELPPHITLYNEPLVQLLGELKASGAAKDARRAAKQQEVKDSSELQKRARKLAANLRSALIAHYGFDSEQLLAYGIPPRRPPKRKPTGTPEAPQPENPEPQRPSAVKAASPAAEQPKPENPAPAAQSNPAAKTA
jgi:hypothetical protein